MFEGWIIILASLAYLGMLFLVAAFGKQSSAWLKTWIYPFSLAVYCTSWTFFGSVGLAARNGYEFIAVYIGPVLMFTLFYPLVLKVVTLAKAQNISSVADFLGARFGKDGRVAALVCLISLIAMVPYIALQLKAVSTSLHVMMPQFEGDLALLVTLIMATFAALFGTKQTDATEHQDGLMAAIALESVIKIIAFLVVGFYISYVVFKGPSDIFTQVTALNLMPKMPVNNSNFIAIAVLGFTSFLLLPRIFHVAVVENRSEAELKRSRWLFPLYIVLINLFVIPLALAGLLSFPMGSVDSDMMMIALPMQAGLPLITLIAFIGGLSAATAMVIMASIALSIMISNDVLLPALLNFRVRPKRDMAKTVLQMRRAVIFIVLMMAYIYYLMAGSHQLASIGLLSFAAIAQLFPAFIAGLFWRGANARGALTGMTIGLLTWVYTLMLPNLADAGVISQGWILASPFKLELTPLANGTLWSLSLNTIALILASKSRMGSLTETVQAQVFVPNTSPRSPAFRLRKTTVTLADLQSTIARYLGEERTRQSFAALGVSGKTDADVTHIRYAEHLLASAIGAASSRLVISNLLKNNTQSDTTALRFLDDAHAVMQYNRDVLQTALEFAKQGISVFDQNHTLILWNKAFTDLLDLPPDMARVGIDYVDILKFLAERGEFGEGELDKLVSMRLERFLEAEEPYKARQIARGLVIEISTAKLPDGGIVATYADVTESVKVAEALEKRVQTRTEELQLAKQEAEEANLSKTRFLAAASHDILQPLNAARLYTTSLVERTRRDQNAVLVANIDASLDAVEEIIGALLDISRLDSGAMKAELSVFSVEELFKQLAVEFAPLAAQKGLTLSFVPVKFAVKSDRKLLRRVLQNLISNALKYTQKGRVLVGARRRGETIRFEIYDSGIGIPPSKQRLIFKEFQRLEQGAKVARGLGLGLSIVERITKLLAHPLSLKSVSDKGSCFTLTVPIAVETPVLLQETPLQLSPLAGMRLLAVDNEPKILEGMATLLEGWGLVIATALSPENALQDEFIPEGLLVDYHLDHGNGIEAIALLRAKYGELPATLITADRSDFMRTQAELYNIHVLNKPLKPAALRALLSQWRAKRGQ
jgi:Na+/proline symporter/signal transduction histidine kinase/CheY-like chemotaxis protein